MGDLFFLFLGRNFDDWVKDLKSENFKLLCFDGIRKFVIEFKSCYLVRVSNYVVVLRKEKVVCVC